MKKYNYDSHREMFDIVEISPVISLLGTSFVVVIAGVILHVVWWFSLIIGILCGGIAYFVGKLHVCYKVMVICNLEDICEKEKLLLKKLEDILETEQLLLQKGDGVAGQNADGELTRLIQLKKLFDEKIISEEEFENEKKRILKQ